MKKMANLLDFIEHIEKGVSYLKAMDVLFSDRGYPVLKKEWFLDEWPDQVVPINHRNDRQIIDKSKVVLCFFAPDIFNYRRIVNIYNEIELYRDYMGIVTFDITVTDDMDEEWQDLIMLANLVFSSVLAVNGIKIILNSRCPNRRNNYWFEGVPKNIMIASSFLGCNSARDYIEANKYIDKILLLLPSKLLIYGKKDVIVDDYLNTLGINYRRYIDFHSCSKEVRSNG